MASTQTQWLASPASMPAAWACCTGKAATSAQAAAALRTCSATRAARQRCAPVWVDAAVVRSGSGPACVDDRRRGRRLDGLLQGADGGRFGVADVMAYSRMGVCK